MLAVALGHHGDAAVILAVVLVNALIGSLPGRPRRALDGRAAAAAHCAVRVLRDGSEQVVEARELVPGDIVLLAAGDAVGADARLIDEARLQVAEAALTGESVPVSKSVQPGARDHWTGRPPLTWCTPAPTSPPAARALSSSPPASTPRWVASPA